MQLNINISCFSKSKSNFNYLISFWQMQLSVIVDYKVFRSIFFHSKSEHPKYPFIMKLWKLKITNGTCSTPPKMYTLIKSFNILLLQNAIFVENYGNLNGCLGKNFSMKWTCKAFIHFNFKGIKSRLGHWREVLCTIRKVLQSYKIGVPYTSCFWYNCNQINRWIK